MLCIEVLFGDDVVCRAGHKDMALLTATLHVLNHPTFSRLIVSGSLEPHEAPDFKQLPRWLDASVLKGQAISLRIVETETADEPARVSSFGAFPGDDKRRFCSFCGAAAENGPPMMLGVSGLICAPCVRNFTKWANEKS